MKRLSVVVAVAAVLASAAMAAVAYGVNAGKVVIKTTPGGAPVHLSAGDGAVWAGDHRGYVLYRIDPRTNKKRLIPISQNTCNPPVFTDRYVFQSGCDDTWTSLQIDVRTNRVIRHIAGLFGVIGAGSLWVVYQDGRVGRIDPKTGVRLATIDPGVDITGNGGPIGVYDGGLWVGADTAVSRIDVETNKVTQLIPLPGAKGSGDLNGGLLAGSFGTFLKGKLWVTNAAGLFEVDPSTAAVVLHPIHVTPMSQFGDLYVVAGAGSLWMRTGDRSVARIDPKTGRIVQRYPATGGGGGLAFGYGSLWVSNAGADTIWRYPIH